MYWAGGNPFHHHQDLNRLLKGWERLDTIISHEWCWNSLAKYSDIVLPCTTPLEREDIGMTPRDPYVISMAKAKEPFKNSLNDFEIFTKIAEKLGLKSKFTGNRSELEWQKWLYKQTKEKAGSAGIKIPSYEVFRSKKWFKLPSPKKCTIMLESFREDPKKNPIKQFIDFGNWTLFGKTLDRVNNQVFDSPIISTNKKYIKLVRKYLKKHKIGNAEIDLNKMTITVKGDQKKINVSEKNVLSEMLSSPGKTFSRLKIGEISGILQERSIDVMITRLRQKIETDPKNPKYLQTIRGSGYVLWIE